MKTLKWWLQGGIGIVLVVALMFVSTGFGITALIAFVAWFVASTIPPRCVGCQGRATLENGDLPVCRECWDAAERTKKILDRFTDDDIAQGLLWLEELRSLGYSNEEIAEMAELESQRRKRRSQ